MRLVLALALMSAACKGDLVKCEQSCRNYATLVFWQKTDADIAKAPAAERDALRKQKQEELDRYLTVGLDMCVSQCQSANNEDTIDCMIAAKTAEKVQACK